LLCAGKNPTDWWTIITVGIQWFRRNPIKHELKQFPFAFVVNNFWLFLIAHIIFHTTPAAIGDVLRMLQGRNAKLVAGSNHLYTVITQLTPFTSRQWQFLADNVDTKLLASMSEQDKNIFEIEVRKIDWEIYTITLVRPPPPNTIIIITHNTQHTAHTHDTTRRTRTRCNAPPHALMGGVWCRPRVWCSSCSRRNSRTTSPPPSWKRRSSRPPCDPSCQSATPPVQSKKTSDAFTHPFCGPFSFYQKEKQCIFVHFDANLVHTTAAKHYTLELLPPSSLWRLMAANSSSASSLRDARRRYRTGLPSSTADT
jgi:hypothetical protein